MQPDTVIGVGEVLPGLDAALADYLHHMETVVIPQIVEDLNAQARHAAELRFPRRALEAHTQAFAQGAEGWLPISSAPKDGTDVDLWGGGRRWTDCRWNSRPYAADGTPWGWGNADHGRITVATHWMPLPPPPAGKP